MDKSINRRHPCLQTPNFAVIGCFVSDDANYCASLSSIIDLWTSLFSHCKGKDLSRNQCENFLIYNKTEFAVFQDERCCVMIWKSCEMPDAP